MFSTRLVSSFVSVWNVFCYIAYGKQSKTENKHTQKKKAQKKGAKKKRKTKMEKEKAFV